MATVMEKLRGTIETIFRIGLGGPQLKNNAGVIEARNPTDAGFVKVRGDAPAGNDDFVTKGYGDANYIAVGISGAVRTIRYVIATAATTDSVAVLPAGARVQKSRLEITAGYDGGATISIGQVGAVTAFMLTTDNDPIGAGVEGTAYEVPQDTAVDAGALVVRTTVGGAPTGGTAVVTIWYSIPDA